MTTTLSHNQFVKVEGVKHKRIRVGTCEGYLIGGETPEEAVAMAKKFGHELAWTSLEASVLHDGSSEQKAKERAQFESDMASAVVLSSGMLVEIEGRKYKVRIVGVEYADPIAFTPV